MKRTFLLAILLSSYCFLSAQTEKFNNDYILLGRKYVGKQFYPINNELFKEYSVNGNRTNYENESNKRRIQLACLVIAELRGQSGEFIPDIINGLHYFENEIWWGIPAHYSFSEPRRDTQTVELVSAGTASLVAWTIYSLHDKLEKAEHGICQRMNKEIERRMLIPALQNDYDWKRRTNNWNPWICSNWLTCIMLCEKDEERKQKALQQIRKCMDIFYDNYPEDGGCDEGISYWDRSVASFIDCCILWEMITGEEFHVGRSDAKLHAMVSYVYRMYIGNNASVNFADAIPYPTLHPASAFLIGKYVNDSTLCNYSAYVAKNFNFENNPSRLFLTSGSFPDVGREILFLQHYEEFINTPAVEPLISDSWLPITQVFSARDKNGLFVAAKGGNNNESHNHNDIGNFIIYNKSNPVIVDLGVGTYTAQTFSSQRYELMNTRSAYHNVPLINGIEQCDGAGYKATDISCSADSSIARFSLNIAEAYPSAAKVRSWQRTITMYRDSVIEIEEDINLKKNKGNTQLVFICYGQPTLSHEGIIKWHTKKGDIQLLYNSDQLRPAVERLQFTDQTLRSAWKDNLYRLALKVISRKKKQVIRYTFK